MTRLIASFRNSFITTLTAVRRITGIFPRRYVFRDDAVARHMLVRQRPAIPKRRCPVCNRDGKGTGEIVRFIGRSVWNAICPLCGGDKFVPARREDLMAHQQRVREMRSLFS